MAWWMSGGCASIQHREAVEDKTFQEQRVPGKASLCEPGSALEEEGREEEGRGSQCIVKDKKK